MSKRLVIGFGTGRCGTKSLARFLDKQPDTTVTHEHLPSMFPQWGDYFNYLTMMIRQPTKIVGNVAYAWIEYIDRLVTDIEDLRLICLDRGNDEEVVESFWSYMHDLEDYEDPLINWPFMGPATKDSIWTAIKLYRYKQNILLDRHPQILHVMTKDLNDGFMQYAILEHIGIDPKDMVLDMERLNKREEMTSEKASSSSALG